MMRGESPQQFMQNLAKANPDKMQGLDFSNMNGTAEQLYSQKGADINKARNDITNELSNFMGK